VAQTTGIELRGSCRRELTHASPSLECLRRSTRCSLDRFIAADSEATAAMFSCAWSQARSNATGPTVSILYRIRCAAPSLAPDAYFFACGVLTALAARLARRRRRAACSFLGRATFCPDAALPAKLSRAARCGVSRVFEWNGTMLHAKTAVGRLFVSRVVPTNLQCRELMELRARLAIGTAPSRQQWPRQYEIAPYALARSCSRVTTVAPRHSGRYLWRDGHDRHAGRGRQPFRPRRRSTRCALPIAAHRLCRIGSLGEVVSWRSYSPQLLAMRNDRRGLLRCGRRVLGIALVIKLSPFDNAHKRAKRARRPVAFNPTAVAGRRLG